MYNTIYNVDGMNGHSFEYFCAELLRENGFSQVVVTQGSGDQGVDIIAQKDGISYAIQCKNYRSSLGNKAIQEVFAGREYYNCDVCAVMTNSYFTTHARELANAIGVILWDRDELEKMLRYANGIIPTDDVTIKSRSVASSKAVNEGKVGPLVMVAIFIIIIIGMCVKDVINNQGPVSLEVLCAEDHPMLFEDQDIADEYYKNFEAVEFKHLSNQYGDEDTVLLFRCDDQYQYLKELHINFDRLKTEEREKISFNDVLEIAVGYIPKNIIEDYFAFDKAIYFRDDDGLLTYQCFYLETDKYDQKPSAISTQHGFSLEIKETANGSYEADLGSDRYDYIYDIDPMWRERVSQEVLDAQKKWNFRLEEIWD